MADSNGGQGRAAPGRVTRWQALCAVARWLVAPEALPLAEAPPRRSSGQEPSGGVLAWLVAREPLPEAPARHAGRGLLAALVAREALPAPPDVHSSPSAAPDRQEPS